MSKRPVLHPQIRKVLQGVASRQQMYALFNRHSQAPVDAARQAGSRYAGEWFEVGERDHDRMFEILPPLFWRGDVFAMRKLRPTPPVLRRRLRFQSSDRSKRCPKYLLLNMAARVTELLLREWAIKPLPWCRPITVITLSKHGV